ETEKTIFETIELNRQCRPDAIQVSIFSPYEGTELHEMCAKNGWIREEPSSNYYTHTTLELPTISSASVDSFHKTFMLYYYSPKALYPFIHAVRFCLERLPRKGRDAMGQPIFRFGQLVGLVKRYGFYTTFKSMVMPHLIKN
ncbi:MAG: hypothetical protein Q7R70_00220, partial [Candidatus Diapherotrites archaeon]|nr:hypothetical protein [Candidatus Diapherotrites archaeon]